jgi:hypothetical protein
MLHLIGGMIIIAGGILIAAFIWNHSRTFVLILTNLMDLFAWVCLIPAGILWYRAGFNLGIIVLTIPTLLIWLVSWLIWHITELPANRRGHPLR